MRTVLVLLSGLVLSAGCAEPEEATQRFKPAFTVFQLMEGPIAHAAEVYWDAVSTIVDEKGITEHFPTNDEEWEAVWASAITLAESGNLLMMSPRAKDDGDWIKFSSAMVDVGVEATKAAESKDPEAVLAAGERIYDACTQCHRQYIPQE